jgi:hypothetical protein
MKNKGVLALTGAVLALSLYAYFGEYKREINEETQKEITSKIVTLKKDQIQKIELRKGDGTTVVIERTVDGWDVTNPLHDQADNETIESFLDQITGEKAVDEIDPKNSDMSEYGLKPSLGLVTLIDNTNHKQVIEVSTKKNFEGLVFLHRDQEKKILTSSQTWTTFLTKPADQFRNLRLYRGSISKVTSIRIENSKGVTEFKYNDGFWFSPQRTDWKIDQNAVREILTQATTARGSEVIAEKKIGPLGAHLLTLEFGSGKETWKALLHQDTKTKDVIAAISPARMIIRFPPQTLEDLRNKKLVDFRDKTEPFRFAKDQIKKIVAHTKIKSFTLIKKGEFWNLEKADPAVVINSTMADDLINKLNRMTVYRFIEGTSPKVNLDSQIQLFDDSGLVFQLAWSEFKDHEGYAQTNVFKETFQIDDAQVNRLMVHEIVKPKPTQKDQKSEKN